jgi:hypothetical protein
MSFLDAKKHWKLPVTTPENSEAFECKRNFAINIQIFLKSFKLPLEYSQLPYNIPNT